MTHIPAPRPDPFSAAIEAAFRAGPTPLEREEARAYRAARRARRRQLLATLVPIWGDRALWALCLLVVAATVGDAVFSS